jgi:hypothetical protein
MQTSITTTVAASLLLAFFGGDQVDRRNQEHTGGRGRRHRPDRGNVLFGGKLNFTPMGSFPIKSESVQQLAEEHGSAVPNVSKR